MKNSFLLTSMLLLPSLGLAADTTTVGIPQLGEFIAALNQTAYENSGKSGPIEIHVDDTKPGITVQTAALLGTDLAVWNSPAVYHDLKPYLIDAGFSWFRFPNGSLSNDYHWNGTGKYDATGIWEPSKKEWTPGFVAETRYRGTTKDNYGFRRPSHITDGDTSTMWWGALYEKKDPPWFVVDLGKEAEVDSMQIDFGAKKPKAFTLVLWDSVYAHYPYAHQLHHNLWKEAYQAKVNSNHIASKFTTKKSRYWAVRFDSKDLGPDGVQVKEFRLFGAGLPVTNNIADPSKQPKTWGISTRSGDNARTDWTDIKWQFESFMEYVQSVPNGRPVICVNVATGSPEEAAAWVHYANKVKGYRIQDWQIGNENDGEWEEAGPLSALQYASKFVSYSKAMKVVDPSIRIHGPLHSTDEFKIKGDGLYTGRCWMESFLKQIGEVEKKEKKRLLDVIDFHTYPYWTSTGVVDSNMLAASARPGPMMDTLNSWINQYLPNPATRRIHLSEFSSTVVGSDQTLRAVQATTVAHLFGQFVSRFGDRGHALPWDTYGSLQKGPDGTKGSMRMANQVIEGLWSSWDKYAPTSQYYGLYLAFHHWTRTGLKVLPVAVADSAVRAFAIGSGDTTRVLLINMTKRVMPVKLDRISGKATPIQNFFFSDANYAWNGTDEHAVAIPGMGPWSDRIEAASTTSVNIPALGMAVVQWDPKALHANPIETVNAGANSTTLLPGDTLKYWITLRQKGGAIQSGTYRCNPFGTGALSFADGKAGGEIEGAYLQIPIPKNAKPGEYRLGIEVEGFGKEGLAETLPFRIRGAFRTVYPMFDFDGAEPAMNTYAHGSNSSNISTNVVPGGKPLGGHLQAPFLIEQPPTLGWPNFAGVHLPLDRNWMEAKQLNGVPEGARIAGITFDYATQHSDSNGYFDLLLLSDVVKDYDEFVYHMRNTHGNWVRDTVLFSTVKQEGWGINKGILEAKAVKELEYRARGQGRGEIRVDNIYLLAEDGTEIPMPAMLRRMR